MKLVSVSENFNSIKVRLKLTNYALYYSKTTFQFHKGTIKTLDISRVQILLSNFNSIKVRLKLVLFM